MSKSVEFFDKFLEGRLAQLHTALPAKIESYDPGAMKAEVQPMIKRVFKGQEPVDLPKIIEVPVATLRAGGFIIRPPFKSGDPVIVLFSERDLDTFINTGKSGQPNSKRKHSLEDAIVIGGLMPFNISLPDDHGDDLIIADEEFDHKIVIKDDDEILIEKVPTETRIKINQDGEIILEAPDKIYIGDDEATEGAALGTSLKGWLDEHTHNFTGVQSGVSSTTGSPVSNSPAPSDKVVIDE